MHHGSFLPCLLPCSSAFSSLETRVLVTVSAPVLAEWQHMQICLCVDSICINGATWINLRMWNLTNTMLLRAAARISGVILHQSAAT